MERDRRPRSCELSGSIVQSSDKTDDICDRGRSTRKEDEREAVSKGDLLRVVKVESTAAFICASGAGIPSTVAPLFLSRATESTCVRHQHGLACPRSRKFGASCCSSDLAACNTSLGLDDIESIIFGLENCTGTADPVRTGGMFIKGRGDPIGAVMRAVDFCPHPVAPAVGSAR